MESYLYEELYELEDKHWWFSAKKDIVISVLKNYIKHDNSANILDLGCGSGLMLNTLKGFGNTYGMDY